MGTPIFLAKRASNSQDTVDYIVQRAARKNSSGFPGLIYSVLAITCPFYKENGCTHTPVALALFGTKLFRTRQSRETHIGVGEGVRWHFFGALAKGDVSSSIALAGRGFLPKSFVLIKYSPLCNLQTETFLQNPIHTFLPCLPKFMSDILCGCGMLRKQTQLFVSGWGLLRPQDE